MKKFLNEIIFLNFICVITSAKFFIDFATKMTTFNSNNLKMIDVLNLIISASSALVQMSRSVVGNSNSSKHSSLTHLSEPAKTEWEIMISFVIDFDNLIVFYSPFCFFFFLSFLAFPASRPPRVPPHPHRANERRRRVKKKSPLCFSFELRCF